MESELKPAFTMDADLAQAERDYFDAVLLGTKAAVEALNRVKQIVYQQALAGHDEIES